MLIITDDDIKHIIAKIHKYESYLRKHIHRKAHKIINIMVFINNGVIREAIMKDYIKNTFGLCRLIIMQYDDVGVIGSKDFCKFISISNHWSRSRVNGYMVINEQQNNLYIYTLHYCSRRFRDLLLTPISHEYVINSYLEESSAAFWHDTSLAEIEKEPIY